MPPKSRHRQCIKDFVREHDAVKGHLGRPLDPRNALKQMRQPLSKKFALPLAKIGADLENPVFVGQVSQLFEAHQDVRGETSGACAYFENRSGVQRTEDLRALLRYATAEQAGNFRRSRKVSARPEFFGAAAV